ncbi:division/cell wall cluster transcriptional repressor MraZ [Chloroflexus sp.]|uniref:division/cell wall cluster transcriptional repressor MraZ n=1 Tax=Chloroflexus sp. TaxID=1904827 RepID=UPI0026294C83|nr:division/cell wall cluster transcriptional repressor MraZ [uncultured Chloroflexus sp.]
MFLGTHEHAIDEKGRLAIPARFRAELAGGMVLTRGFDRCLLIFPLPFWSELTRRVSALSLVDEDARMLRRLLFASASEQEMDRQGRILLPQSLREVASLTEQAVLVGLDTYIEVWSPERWREVEDRLASQGPRFDEQMRKLGI